MTLYFSGGAGDAYTCEFRSSPIDVTRAQAAGNGQDAMIGTVLDTYANQFYDNIRASWSPGEAGVVISKTGNQIYGVTALVMAGRIRRLPGPGHSLLPGHPGARRVQRYG